MTAGCRLLYFSFQEIGNRKGKDMNYYTTFDPYLNRERNEELRKEVNASRLEERLRRSRGRRVSRLGEIARTAALPMLRRTKLSG